MFKIEGYIDGLSKDKIADILSAIYQSVKTYDDKLELVAVITEDKEDENGEAKGTPKL